MEDTRTRVRTRYYVTRVPERIASDSVAGFVPDFSSCEWVEHPTARSRMDAIQQFVEKNGPVGQRRECVIVVVALCGGVEQLLPNTPPAAHMRMWYTRAVNAVWSPDGTVPSWRLQSTAGLHRL